MTHFSFAQVLKGALTGQKHCTPQWPDAQPKTAYDVIIVGAGGQELRAQKSHDELARLTLSPGDKVWMSWGPDAIHVLPGR